jgi:phage-related holin
MTEMIPLYVDVFLSPIRDNSVAQVAVTAVLLLIILDWIFGVANAIMHKEFESSKMREGIAHKCGELGFLLVGLVTDGVALGGVDIGMGGYVFTAFCTYIIVMEIGSLMEIVCKLDPKLADSPGFKLLKNAKAIRIPDAEEIEG